MEPPLSPTSTSTEPVEPVEAGKSELDTSSDSGSTGSSDGLTSPQSPGAVSGADTSGPSGPSTFVNPYAEETRRRQEAKLKKKQEFMKAVLAKQSADREAKRKANAERKKALEKAKKALALPVGVPRQELVTADGVVRKGTIQNLKGRFLRFIDHNFSEIEEEFLFLLRNATPAHMARIRLMEKVMDKILSDQRETGAERGPVQPPINLVINNLNRGQPQPKRIEIIETTATEIDGSA